MCSECVCLCRYFQSSKLISFRTICCCWCGFVFGVIVLSQCFFRINKAGLHRSTGAITEVLFNLKFLFPWRLWCLHCREADFSRIEANLQQYSKWEDLGANSYLFWLWLFAGWIVAAIQCVLISFLTFSVDLLAAKKKCFSFSKTLSHFVYLVTTCAKVPRCFSLCTTRKNQKASFYKCAAIEALYIYICVCSVQKREKGSFFLWTLCLPSLSATQNIKVGFAAITIHYSQSIWWWWCW